MQRDEARNLGSSGKVRAGFTAKAQRAQSSAQRVMIPDPHPSFRILHAACCILHCLHIQVIAGKLVHGDAKHL